VTGDLQKTGTEITFIEQEAIEAMRREGVRISPDQTRRNIITQGVSLNDLVGREFMVGASRLRGVRLREPCDYLASRTDPQVKQSMAHRGGLRANILTDSIIHLDDPITSSIME
jgi:MOSC domain-containing protein YiiM